MKYYKALRKTFGINEFGMIDYPIKISNVKVSRVLNGINRGCPYCFPHGFETNNAKHCKYQRCWKKYRKTQYK